MLLSTIIPKRMLSEKHFEKFLVLNLLLSNVFKSWNVPTIVFHVALSVGRDREKKKRLELFDDFQM